VGGIDFGGFEGAVGGAVGEGVGEGFAVGGELLAGGVAELVEQVDAGEQGGFGFLQGGEDLGVAEVLRALEGDVATDGGEAWQFLELGGAFSSGVADDCRVAHAGGAGGSGLAVPHSKPSRRLLSKSRPHIRPASSSVGTPPPRSA